MTNSRAAKVSFAAHHGDSGTVTKRYSYDAFGNEENPDSTDTNPFRYCGEYFDKETGSYYLRARYYDPAIGRFTQQDSHWSPANMIYGDNPRKIYERQDALGLSTCTYAPEITAIMQSGNLYVYCVGNPVRYSDYTGFWTIAIGGNFSAAFLLRIGITGQLVIDGNGNAGILVTPALGGGTPSLGGSLVFAQTNADDIYQLREFGFEVGGSFSGIPWLPIGLGLEVAGGVGFVGTNTTINGELKPWLEGHGEVTYSFLIPIPMNKLFYREMFQMILEKTISELGDKLSSNDRALIDSWLNEFCR